MSGRKFTDLDLCVVGEGRVHVRPVSPRAISMLDGRSGVMSIDLLPILVASINGPGFLGRDALHAILSDAVTSSTREMLRAVSKARQRP